jgi:CRP-like cAMP-binding protein/HEAT repeat protein
VTPTVEASRPFLWRLLPGVRPNERSRFLFFLALSGMIQFSQTVGLASAEALFLARVGVGQLPLAFVVAAAVTVTGSLAYAAIVGRRRNDLLYAEILLLSAGLLVILAFSAQLGLGWAPLALLCAFYLTYSVLLNHFWTFAGDYFDALASKRLFPLFLLGGSVGGLVGGAVTGIGSRLLSPEILLFVWSGGLGLAAAMIIATAGRLRRWFPLDLEERDETSVEGIRVAAHYLRRSPLGRSLVLSAVGMVLALFVMQYLYSGIFVRAFPDEAELAAFLGFYLAVTNLFEIAISGFVTPRLIQRLGLGSANIIHPVLTVVSFVLLLVDQRLHAAVLARMNREMLEQCLALPVRTLVQNALPLRLRGQIRAFLEGMVVYAGMVLAGGLLIAIGPVKDPFWIGVAGGLAGVLYLFANVRVRRAYLQAIVEGVLSGRVDLREQSDEIGAGEVGRLVDLWERLLPNERTHPSPALRQLARLLAGRGVVGPLIESASHPSVGVRRATVEALAVEFPEDALEVMAKVLEDLDAEVRLYAARAWADRREHVGEGAPFERLRACLDDSDPRVRAESARALGPEGGPVIRRMAFDENPRTAEAGLRCVPESLVDIALERIGNSDVRIRAAALEAVTRLASPVPLELSQLRDELSQTDVRVRCAAVSALATRREPEARALLAKSLSDPARDVRQTTAKRIAELGEEGVELARASLESQPVWAIESALKAIAGSGTAHTRPILTGQFRARARQIWNAFRILQSLPEDGDLSSRFLRAAYEDALLQNSKLIFRILELIEEPALIRSVEKALLFGSGFLRAEALEVLSHLGDREEAGLLVAVLEHVHTAGAPKAPRAATTNTEDLESILSGTVKTLDRWIRIASATQARAGDLEATMERLLTLRNVSIFSQMSLDQLEAINGLLVESEFVAGEVIMREGDPGTDLFLLMNGRVAIVKGHDTDQAVELSQLGEGACIGEIGVLYESSRTATVLAIEDCTLLSLSGDRFKELIYDMPELAFAIFRVFTGRLLESDERLQRAVLAEARLQVCPAYRWAEPTSPDGTRRRACLGALLRARLRCI